MTMPLPMLHISVHMDDRQELYTEADSSNSQAGESMTLRGAMQLVHSRTELMGSISSKANPTATH